MLFPVLSVQSYNNIGGVSYSVIRSPPVGPLNLPVGYRQSARTS